MKCLVHIVSHIHNNGNTIGVVDLPENIKSGSHLQYSFQGQPPEAIYKIKKIIITPEMDDYDAQINLFDSKRYPDSPIVKERELEDKNSFLMTIKYILIGIPIGTALVLLKLHS